MDFMTAEPQLTILVVEDNPDSRQLLCYALRKKGYNVIEAENGKHAIVQASRCHPDMILMDLAMPEMDGITSVRHILQLPKLASTPIFAVSAFATQDVEADALSAGCKEVLEKPIDLEVLLEKIGATLKDAPVQQKERREDALGRKVERVQTSIPVNWGITWECPHVGSITSLSINGCLVETNLILALIGKHVFLRFQLPMGEMMSLQGRVLYYLRNVGFGMEFRELTEKDKDILKQLVEQHGKNHSL
jgi:CheY-like chemotaxis protein